MNPRGAAPIAAVLAACLALGGQAQAFGTVDGLGQHSEHRRITLWALAGLGLGPGTMRQLAGRGGWSFGAVGAADNPTRGLVDFKAAHCDGGDYLDAAGYPQGRRAAQAHIENCRAWIFRQIDMAIADAGGLADPAAVNASLNCRFDGRRTGTAKCRTLEDLGLALHAAQDFYAHTNWVDRPAAGEISAKNPPGLGHSGAAPWLRAGVQMGFPDGLISGCYDGFPEFLHCGVLIGPLRVAHRVLDKDNGPINPKARTVGPGSTPRGRIGDNFQRAVAAAVDDSRARWLDFQQQVTARYGATQGHLILCRLKSDVPSACRT